jgi:hypothetical protein
MLLSLNACTVLQVAEIDKKTGLLPTSIEANISTNIKIDLDKRKSLLVMDVRDLKTHYLYQHFSYIAIETFHLNQAKKISFFSEVNTLEELELTIIKNDLSEKIPTLDSGIGLNNAAKHYKPFLLLTIKHINNGKNFRLTLTDPLTLEEHLVAISNFQDWISPGRDQATSYPLYNALIQFIKDNSNTYK